MSIEKVAGDSQIASRGSPVPVPPQVRVSDAFRNPVAGVTVLFKVAGGEGSLTGENGVTNAFGIATVGSWTLGEAGGQSLTATSPGLESLTFGAVAFESTHGCVQQPALTSGTPAESELSPQGCQSPDGRFFELYAIELPNPGAYQFKLESTEFDTRLELRTGSGYPMAVNGSADATSNSAIKAILPAGQYILTVSSVNPEAVGIYSVSYAPSTSRIKSCEDVFIARGASTEQFVAGDDCPGTWSSKIDRFRIYMTRGDAILAILEDYSLSDNLFEMRNEKGDILAVGLVKNYVESDLSFRAPADGYYVISVQVEYRYVLTVR
jgi:hypothetical protein